MRLHSYRLMFINIARITCRTECTLTSNTSLLAKSGLNTKENPYWVKAVQKSSEQWTLSTRFRRRQRNCACPIGTFGATCRKSRTRSEKRLSKPSRVARLVVEEQD